MTNYSSKGETLMLLWYKTRHKINNCSTWQMDNFWYMFGLEFCSQCKEICQKPVIYMKRFVLKWNVLFLRFKSALKAYVSWTVFFIVSFKSTGSIWIDLANGDWYNMSLFNENISLYECVCLSKTNN